MMLKTGYGIEVL